MAVAPWTIPGSSPGTSLVLQGSNRQRPLSAVRLRYIRPAGRLRPVCSPVDPTVQVREPRLEVCLVVRPRQAIHTRGGISLQRVECHPQRIDVDVMQECGEPFLLPLPCGVPTGSSPVAGSRDPAPGSRLPSSVPGACVAGSRSPPAFARASSSLHPLRGRSPVLVRRLHPYYGRV